LLKIKINKMKQRRKAIDAKLIGESKTSPGYFKYQFTILELDGTTHVMPAYGKDMEDALERLVWVERTEKKPFNIMVITALLTIIVVPSIIAAMTSNPVWVLGALGLATLYGVVMVRVDKYFNKK
jgi:hypothetical protein